MFSLMKNLIIALNYISPVFRLESGLCEASEFPDLNLESSLGWSPSPCTTLPRHRPTHPQAPALPTTLLPFPEGSLAPTSPASALLLDTFPLPPFPAPLGSEAPHACL